MSIQGIKDLCDRLDSLRDKEIEARKLAGQEPYHGSSLDDLFFTHSANEFLSIKLALQEPHNEYDTFQYHAAMFTTLFCDRKHQAAQNHLEALQIMAPKSLYSGIDLTDEFLSITDEDMDLIWGPYPETMMPKESLLCLMADARYHALFGSRLCATIPSDVRKHLVTLSDGDGVYYHAVRFIRFYRILKQATHPVWLMDVDALFHRIPQGLFDSLGDKDCAFRIRPGRTEPWNQFSAGIVGARPTALPYFKAIAQYLTFTKGKWFWGIDQLAMYLAWVALKDKSSVSFLDNRVFNLSCDDEGIVWILGGKDKFDMLAGKEFDPTTPQGRYAAKFRSIQ